MHKLKIKLYKYLKINQEIVSIRDILSDKINYYNKEYLNYMQNKLITLKLKEDILFSELIKSDISDYTSKNQKIKENIDEEVLEKILAKIIKFKYKKLNLKNLVKLKRIIKINREDLDEEIIEYYSEILKICDEDLEVIYYFYLGSNLINKEEYLEIINKVFKIKGFLKEGLVYKSK